MYYIRTLFALGVVLMLVTCECQTSSQYQSPGWGMMDSILNQIQEPLFPERVVQIKRTDPDLEGHDYSESINRAIQNISEQGGGTVLIPEGIYHTGPIRLLDNVRIHLEEGAELRFSTDPSDYLPVVQTRWEGIDCYNYRPLIYASHAENVAITGKGILNGMAGPENWWPWKGREDYGYEDGDPSQLDQGSRPRLEECNEKQVPVNERIFGAGSYLRPQFIQFFQCRNILIEDITIIRSPFWLIHPLLSENIIMRRVTMESSGPNNDGCDPESSKNMLIEDCFFNTGDDCIAIKSGRNQDGRRWNRPSENIVIRNCTMHNGHGGVVIGSEISGGCRNIFAVNSVMDSPGLQRAIRIKTNTQRGGVIENIFIRNIKVGQVDEAVLRINCHYDSKKEGEGEFVPCIRNIHLVNVESRESMRSLYLEGVEGKKSICDIFVVDCHFNGVKSDPVISEVTNLVAENTFVNEKQVDRF